MSFTPALLEEAIARVQELSDEDAREAARSAVMAVLDFHREAMVRLSERLRSASPEGDRLLRAVAEDEVVASAFLLHGIHPEPLEVRVRRAVGHACASEPTMEVHLESLSSERVALRVNGGNDALRRAIARAVQEAAPDLDRVDVIGPSSNLLPADTLVRHRGTVGPHCELCGETLGTAHPHLFDAEARKVTCACTACALLFDGPMGTTKMRPISRKAIWLDDFRISDTQWAALKVPVRLAFFSRSSALRQMVVTYPGLAGTVESEVALEAWEALAAGNPALGDLEPDVEALLVDRLGDLPRYGIVSIDECYRLAGFLRSHVRGAHGEDGPRRAVADFFASLREGAP